MFSAHACLVRGTEIETEVPGADVMGSAFQSAEVVSVGTEGFLNYSAS